MIVYHIVDFIHSHHYNSFGLSIRFTIQSMTESVVIYKTFLFLSVFLIILINPAYLLADSSGENSKSRLNLAHFPSAFGLDAHHGDVDIRQARVFIRSAGGKKRRVTENNMSF